MRESSVHIYLFVFVEACIVPCDGDCKAYPFLQKIPTYMQDLFG